MRRQARPGGNGVHGADALRRCDRLDGGHVPRSAHAGTVRHRGAEHHVHQGFSSQPGHAARVGHRHMVSDDAGRGTFQCRPGRGRRCAPRPVRRPLSAAAVFARLMRIRAAVEVPHAADRVVRLHRRRAAAPRQYAGGVSRLRFRRGPGRVDPGAPQRHHLRHRSVAGCQRRQHVALLRRHRSRSHRHVRPLVRRPDDLSRQRTRRALQDRRPDGAGGAVQLPR